MAVAIDDTSRDEAHRPIAALLTGHPQSSACLPTLEHLERRSQSNPLSQSEGGKSRRSHPLDMGKAMNLVAPGLPDAVAARNP